MRTNVSTVQFESKTIFCRCCCTRNTGAFLFISRSPCIPKWSLIPSFLKDRRKIPNSIFQGLQGYNRCKVTKKLINVIMTDNLRRNDWSHLACPTENINVISENNGALDAGCCNTWQSVFKLINIFIYCHYLVFCKRDLPARSVSTGPGSIIKKQSVKLTLQT